MASSRQSKALSQRLLLADFEIIVDENIASFEIIGSTGNIYTVKINRFPSCSCPDYRQRQTTCKHIYFTLSKVLQQPEEIWKKGSDFDEDQVAIFLARAQNLQDSRKHCVKKDSGIEIVEIFTDEEKKKQKDLKEQGECPICLCEFVHGEDVIFCYMTCGMNLHKMCFHRMKKEQCPMCRSEMKIARKKAVKRKASENLVKERDVIVIE